MINRLDHVISWLEMVWYLKGLRGLALLSYLKFPLPLGSWVFVDRFLRK